MRTLNITPTSIEFTPAYVPEMKLFGIVMAVIFSGAAILAFSEFGFHWGPFIPVFVACCAATLTSYDVIFYIKPGAITFERKWMNKMFKKNIELNNFMSIKIESKFVRTSTSTRVAYFPVLWSKENFMFSRLNYSFIGFISNENFKSDEDFIRMLKVMSNITNLPVSFSNDCPKRFFGIYSEL